MEVKVVLVGELGSGKTLVVRRLGALVLTEARAPPGVGKESVTSALDYAKVVAPGLKVHVFGTPGLRLFSFMALHVLRGAHLVVGVDKDGSLERAWRVVSKYPGLPKALLVNWDYEERGVFRGVPFEAVPFDDPVALRRAFIRMSREAVMAAVPA